MIFQIYAAQLFRPTALAGYVLCLILVLRGYSTSVAYIPSGGIDLFIPRIVLGVYNHGTQVQFV